VAVGVTLGVADGVEDGEGVALVDGEALGEGAAVGDGLGAAVAVGEGLAVTAGVRFSDLFTDVSYILAAPSLTTLGWALLTPPPVLNLVGVVIMLWGYNQMQKAGRPNEKRPARLAPSGKC